MPGGMGGLGQILGMLGGMGGPGMGGGMRMDRQQAQESHPDEYDLNRWQRADAYDITAMEEVRADWDAQAQKKKKRMSFLKKLGKKEPETAEPESDRPPAKDPVPRPERKTIAEAGPTPEIKPETRKDVRSAEVRGFFSENPVNSTLLATDALSLGPLALNQIKRPKVNSRPHEAETRSEDSYMAARKETTENRKYDVRIVD